MVLSRMLLHSLWQPTVCCLGFEIKCKNQLLIFQCEVYIDPHKASDAVGVGYNESIATICTFTCLRNKT